jgi:hypothetical protein
MHGQQNDKYTVQVSLKSDKNNKYVTWRPTHIYDNISLTFSRMRNVSDKIIKKVVTFFYR